MKQFLLILFCYFLVGVDSQRTRNKMYDNIIGASCFRRLNATHQTGCTSSFGGSVGVLHLVKKLEDFNFVLNDPPAPPYAVVVLPYLFTRENILRLKNSSHISAIVLINNTTKMESFSPELNCPNHLSGLIKDQTCDASKPDKTWNPFGSGLLHEDFHFPIYYIHDLIEIDKIVECYEKFNSFDFEKQHERSLCSIQINTLMSAAGNSEICMRRSSGYASLRYCDPLSGKNIYATLFPRKIINPEERKIDKNEKIILISTRLDTTSMFDGIGLGAMGSLVSYATLVSTGHLISRLLPNRKSDDQHNIMFMFFNGESYDYIGSQRFVYDIAKQNFPSKNSYTNPISFENIELLIDIGTLDDPASIKAYHYTDFDMIGKVTNLLNKYNKKFNFNSTTTTIESLNLPPTSAQSFLRNNTNFPAMILTTNPTNRFYHSIYDDYENINYKYKNTSEDFTQIVDLNVNDGFEMNSIQMKIRNISSMLAFSLYEMITGDEYVGNKGANLILADELLYCFLISSNCSLFHAASPPDSQTNSGIPPMRYISVQNSLALEGTTSTLKVLAYLIGHKQNDYQKSNCSRLPYYWVAGFNGTGECYLTTQNTSQALSPAFIEENYDWKSGKYSTWTESTWRELSANIFLQPSKSHEILTLSIGIVVLLISFVLVFLINSKSDILFGNALSSVAASISPAHC